MKKAFCSWSGGKDCSLALLSYLEQNPNTTVQLLTMLRQDLQKTYGHGFCPALLSRQAAAMELPIVFGFTQADNYEIVWLNQLQVLKDQGFTQGIFGDIDLQEHYDWISRTMASLEMEAVFPLWQLPRQSAVEKILATGIRAKVTAVNLQLAAISMLGMEYNAVLLDYLGLKKIDPSAEGGEFHTIVYDGPLFKAPLLLLPREIIEYNDYAFLEYQ